MKNWKRKIYIKVDWRTLIVFFCFMSFLQHSKAQAVFVFDTEHKELGVFEINDTLETFFEFKNMGNQPGSITNVVSSCGCVHFKWPKGVLGVGEKGVIKVQIETKEEPKGSLFKDLIVTTDTAVEEYYLTMSAWGKNASAQDSLYVLQMKDHHSQTEANIFMVIEKKDYKDEFELKLVNKGKNTFIVKDVKALKGEISLSNIRDKTLRSGDMLSINFTYSKTKDIFLDYIKVTDVEGNQILKKIEITE